MSMNMMAAEIVAALKATDVWAWLSWAMSQPPSKFAPQPNNGDFRNVRPDVGQVHPDQAAGTRTALMQGMPAPMSPVSQAQPQPGQVTPEMAAAAVAALRGQRSQRPTAYEAAGDDPQDVRLMAMGYRPNRPKAGGFR
jgi:hypothetical protein